MDTFRWVTTVHYFTVFLPASTDGSDKNACKTERFKLIYAALKPGEELLTKARVKCLLFICELSSPFLRQFQSEKPNIHNLYTNSTALFTCLAKLIMRPNMFKKIDEIVTREEVDWFDSEIVLSAKHCSTLVSVMKDELLEMPGGLEGSIAKSVLADAKFAVQGMVDYLFSHLPLTNKLLQNIGFLHPRVRELWTGEDGTPSLIDAALAVAKELNRFDEEEVMNLQIQLAIYQSLSNTPNYKECDDRVDHWWVKIFKMVEDERGSVPKELMKIVKMCLVLAHSQGWVERGFNISKMFAADRESLSLQSMKALKMVFADIKRQGGAHKVFISKQMLHSVKMAGCEAKEAAIKKKAREERAAATEALERAEGRKRRDAEEKKKAWESRKNDLECELRGIQSYIDTKQRFIDETLSKVAKSTDPYKMKGWMTAVRLANDDKRSRSDEERRIQDELRSHALKRRRLE